jgi:hypothetical protein
VDESSGQGGFPTAFRDRPRRKSPDDGLRRGSVTRKPIGVPQVSGEIDEAIGQLIGSLQLVDGLVEVSQLSMYSAQRPQTWSPLGIQVEGAFDGGERLVIATREIPEDAGIGADQGIDRIELDCAIGRDEGLIGSAAGQQRERQRVLGKCRAGIDGQRAAELPLGPVPIPASPM